MGVHDASEHASIGAEADGKLVGVAIAGRPVARLLDNGKTLEVLRVCTNGTRNANSFLYDKVRKIAALMGYEKVITYTLPSESGASLKAIGAKVERTTKPQSWTRSNRPRHEQPIFGQEKLRWNIPLPV
jgi:hypothetical protein